MLLSNYVKDCGQQIVITSNVLCQLLKKSKQYQYIHQEKATVTSILI